jgi:hypothetical protein
MHSRLRISASYRREAMIRNLEICQRLHDHINSCPFCEPVLCSIGEELYDGFLKAKAENLVLQNDNPLYAHHKTSKP